MEIKMRTDNTSFQSLLKIACSAVLLLGAALYTNAHAELPPLHSYSGTEYVSGGIGLDQSTEFKAAMSQFPLAMTFASQLDGKAAYVSEVQVVIRDQHGNTTLNAASEGPYFLVKLPPGHYEVFATYNSKTLSRKVDIGAKGSTRAMFEWK